MENSNRSLLIFSYYFPPLGMGGVQRISKFVKYLPQFNWSPAVVTVKPIRYYAYDPTLYREIHHCPVYRTGSLDPNRLAYLFSGKEAVAPGHPSLHTGCSAIFKQVFDFISLPDSKIGWAPFSACKGFHLLKNSGFSAILTTSPPLSAHLPGMILAARKRIPWIADFRDHWLTEFLSLGKTGPKALARRNLAAKIVSGARAVTAVSDPILTELKSLSGNTRTRFLTLPNGFDPEDFHTRSTTGTDKFTITYCGTLSTMLNPEPFFKALAAAVSRRPDMRSEIRVRLVGKAIDIDLEPIISIYGAGVYTEMYGYVPHSEAVSEMKAADLLLFILPDICSTGMVTGKMYEYIASGRPILAFSGDCEARRILNDHPGCSLVTSRQSEEAAEIIIQRFDAWKRSGTFGGPSYSYPNLHRFDRREHTRVLADMLNDLALITT